MTVPAIPFTLNLTLSSKPYGQSLAQTQKSMTGTSTRCRRAISAWLGWPERMPKLSLWCWSTKADSSRAYQRRL